MNAVMQLQRAHASVRQFTDQPIATELLQQLIECGQCAASSSFIQGYSIVRVVDRDKRNTIAVAAGKQQWIIDAAEFLVFCADLKRVEHACIQAGRGQLEGYTEHFLAASVDVALMAQNVLLAAESAGLGGVYIGGIRNDPQVVSDCLQLPELVYPVFGMCLGWPEVKPATKPRLPAQVVLHEDAYRDSVADDVAAYDTVMRGYYSSRGSNVKDSDWSEQTANAIQGKKREHMLDFLQRRRFLRR